MLHTCTCSENIIIYGCRIDQFTEWARCCAFFGSTGILSIIVSYLEATGKPAGGAAQRRVEVHHFLAHVVADAHVEGALVAAAVARAAVGVCDESVREA